MSIKPKKSAWTRISEMLDRVVDREFYTAGGTETRSNRGIEMSGEVPVYRPTIIPRSWQERLIADARSHRDPEQRRQAKIRLEGYCEELVADFIRRRRSYGAASKIKHIAKLAVREEMHPGSLASYKEVCTLIGISERTYYDKRKDGHSWHDDIQHVRQFWVTSFMKNRRL